MKYSFVGNLEIIFFFFGWCFLDRKIGNQYPLVNKTGNKFAFVSPLSASQKNVQSLKNFNWYFLSRGVGGLFFFPFEIIPFQETSLFGFRSLLYMLKWLRYSIANWNSVLFAQKIKLFFYLIPIDQMMHHKGEQTRFDVPV